MVVRAHTIIIVRLAAPLARRLAPIVWELGLVPALPAYLDIISSITFAMLPVLLPTTLM